MIGKILSVEEFKRLYTAVPSKRAVAAAPQTISRHEAILATIKGSNKRPAPVHNYGKMLANAYDRGEQGISKRYESARIYRYHVIGRLALRLPNL